MEASKPEMFNFRAFKLEEINPEGNAILQTKTPRPRSGHRIVTDDANVYSFGGYNPLPENISNEENQHDFLFRELWKFNLATKTWEKLQTKGPMPTELASHSAVLLGKTLVVFGGTGVPFGSSSSNKVHKCSLKSLEWREVTTTGDVPIEQYGQAVTVEDTYMYVIGGTTGFLYTIDVHRLDLRTNQWEELRTSFFKPDERYRHEVVVFEGKIYVFGGGTALNSFSFKCVPAFNLETRAWEELKTVPDLSLEKGYPSNRRCHGCVKYKSDVYICGGQNGSKICPDMWKINLKTMKWTRLNEQLPEPVSFHSVALSDSGQMFIFGGVTNFQEEKRSNRLFSMWLGVPSLREICWNSIVYYQPKIGGCSREKILAAGVPPNLVNRVDFRDHSQRRKM